MLAGSGSPILVAQASRKDPDMSKVSRLMFAGAAAAALTAGIAPGSAQAATNGPGGLGTVTIAEYQCLKTKIFSTKCVRWMDTNVTLADGVLSGYTILESGLLTGFRGCLKVQFVSKQGDVTDGAEHCWWVRSDIIGKGHMEVAWSEAVDEETLAQAAGIKLSQYNG